jgi:Tfp pilus assembly PilM family ATPase
MRPNGKPIIGIELNQDEIRIAEIRGSWAEPRLLSTSAAPMPAHAFVDGMPVDIEAAAAALRRLVAGSGISTRSAVIALPPHLTTCRVIETPDVPNTEMATVIRGELVHLQIVRDEASNFDYARLAGDRSAPDAPASVLVMAAEAAIVERYASIVTLAGLDLAGAEPMLLAMQRAAGLAMQPDRGALTIAVHGSAVEIAICGGGELRLYRRLDLGCSPAAQRRETAQTGHLPLARELNSLLDEHFAIPLAGGEAAATAFESNTEDSGTQRLASDADDGLDPLGARMLALDVQRSLDYCAGRFPNAEPVAHGMLVISEPELRPLAGRLAEALGIEITLSIPMIASGLAHTEETTDLRFQPALGLAMRALTGLCPPLPCLDLSPKARSRGAIRLRGGSPLLAAAISSLILAVGCAAGHQAALRAGHAREELSRSTAVLAQRTQEQSELAQRIQGRIDTLRELSAKGYPIATVADEVAEAVPPGIGLHALRFGAGGKLLLTGEAADERAVIRALEGLKASRHLNGISLDRFDRRSEHDPGSGAIQFEVTAQIVDPAESGAAPVQEASR